MRISLSVAPAVLTACMVVFVSIAHADPLEGLMGGENLPLSRDEVALLDALKRTRPEDTETQSRTVIAIDNTVQYVFGLDEPRAICTPFDGCDIRLEAGEIVRQPSIGDKRWEVDVLFEGDAPNETPHIAIYPHTIGLKTTLIVTTNRRTYHIKLTSRAPSDDEPSTPKIAFLYPEDARARFAAARARQEQARAALRPSQGPRPTPQAARPQGPSELGTAVFAYALTGRAPWKPLRVFNDGLKTHIDFPNAVQHTELPTLLEVRTPGDIFHDDELVLINTNYDPVSRRMTADRVFDHALLIAGVGRNQVKVEIVRLPPPR